MTTVQCQLCKKHSLIPLSHTSINRELSVLACPVCDGGVVKVNANRKDIS
jgi:Zn finger protein HypA/HybF involved in hydrogenase expression